MKTRLTTIILLLSAGIVLISWDIYVATNAIQGDTISELVLAFVRRYPSIAFTGGFIAGHLLWPQYIKEA